MKKDDDSETRVDHTQYDRPLATAGSVVAGSGQITADDLDNLRHMLGVEKRTPRGYRNYFVAGGKDVESMERLRAHGFVVKNERYALSEAPCYHATLEGARAVGLKSLPR
jgi:hypothetical protein